MISIAFWIVSSTFGAYFGHMDGHEVIGGLIGFAFGAIVHSIINKDLSPPNYNDF